MSVTRIASRYAKSLIDLATERGNLERILKDIEDFQQSAKNRDLYLLLKSPIINTSKKAQIFKVLFSDKYDELSLAFLNIILNKKREAQLPAIADEFVSQYRAIKGISTITLTTAAPIGEKTLASIKAKLADSTATSSNVELLTSVNPDILGGFVIEFDDKRYDASIAHKLEQLRKEFTKNEFVKAF